MLVVSVDGKWYSQDQPWRVTWVRGRRRLQRIGPNGEALETRWLAQETPETMKKIIWGGPTERNRGW